MEKIVICSSCNTSIANLGGTVKFKCPKCGKSEIIRCPKCRRNNIKYKCFLCNFEGPN